MFKDRIRFKKTVSLLMLQGMMLCSFISSMAQNKQTLRPADPSPSLRFGKPCEGGTPVLYSTPYTVCCILYESSYGFPVNAQRLTGKDGFSISENSFCFSSYYMDTESGNYYCQARYYSPEMMRFISRDTYDLSNRYAYCNGNPAMSIDPDGHMSTEQMIPIIVSSVTMAIMILAPIAGWGMIGRGRLGFGVIDTQNPTLRQLSVSSINGEDGRQLLAPNAARQPVPAVERSNPAAGSHAGQHTLAPTCASTETTALAAATTEHQGGPDWTQFSELHEGPTPRTPFDHEMLSPIETLKNELVQNGADDIWIPSRSDCFERDLRAWFHPQTQAKVHIDRQGVIHMIELRGRVTDPKLENAMGIIMKYATKLQSKH